MEPLPYVKFSSIHDCVNRFLVVHDTQSVRVEGNVGYNTIGSGFYLEDDSDPLYDAVRKVELLDNLGMAVNQVVKTYNFPNQVQDVEVNEPSVFWIQHPDNKVAGNHAAGGFGHGFYLLPSKKTTWSHEGGASYFRGNVAHSNGQSGFYHNGRPSWNYEPGDDPAGEDLTAYKNRRYGVWWRTFGVSYLKTLRIADNKSGIYPASEGELYAGTDPVSGALRGAILAFEDCTILGESPNVGEPGNAAELAAGRSLPQTHMVFQRWDEQAAPHNVPWDALNAFEAYDGFDRMGSAGIRVGFFADSVPLPDPLGVRPPAVRKSAGITQAEYLSRFGEDPRNFVQAWTVAAVQHPIYFRLATSNPVRLDNMIRNTVVHDVDGSLTGGQVLGVYYAYRHPFLVANCTVNPPVFPAPIEIASLNLYQVADAGADYAQIWVKPRDGTWNGDARMNVTVTDYSGSPQVMELWTAGAGQDGAVARFPFNAVLGLNKNPAVGQTGVYVCSFPNGSTMPEQYEIKIQFCERVDVPTILAVPLVNAPTTLKLNGDSGYLFNREADLPALLASTKDDA